MHRIVPFWRSRPEALLARLLLPAALALAVYAQKPATRPAPAAPSAGFSKSALETYLRHQFMLPANLIVLVADPQPSEIAGMRTVDVTVSDGGGGGRQQVQFYVSADGNKIMQGKVFDLRQSPFDSDLKLLKSADAPRLGPANATVSVVVFSDFQCQYCKEEGKTLRANLLSSYPAGVKLLFKDFPLEQIHPWAKQAAIIGKCIHRLSTDRFWEYHDWIFENQQATTAENLKPKALEFANSKSLDTLQLTQCIDGKITEKDVDASTADARALQVTSTPTLFVNGRRMVGNIAWAQLKTVIDYELEYARKHPARSEPCCDVTIPTPAAK